MINIIFYNDLNHSNSNVYQVLGALRRLPIPTIKPTAAIAKNSIRNSKTKGK